MTLPFFLLRLLLFNLGVLVIRGFLGWFHVLIPSTSLGGSLPLGDGGTGRVVSSTMGAWLEVARGVGGVVGALGGAGRVVAALAPAESPVGTTEARGGASGYIGRLYLLVAMIVGIPRPRTPRSNILGVGVSVFGVRFPRRGILVECVRLP